MKTTIFILLFFIPASLFCQRDFIPSKTISSQFIWSNVGANIAVSCAWGMKKIEPFAGILYHINTPVRDIRFHQYKHRFYNKNFVDGLGLTLGFSKPIRIPDSDIGLYFLFTNQISHMHNRYLIAYCDTSSINYQGARQPDYIYLFSPSQMWILENTIGLGVNIKVWRNLYMNASAAIGLASYMVKNSYTNNTFFRDSEIGEQFRFGFNFRLPSGSNTD